MTLLGRLRSRVAIGGVRLWGVRRARTGRRSRRRRGRRGGLAHEPLGLLFLQALDGALQQDLFRGPLGAGAVALVLVVVGERGGDDRIGLELARELEQLGPQRLRRPGDAPDGRQRHVVAHQRQVLGLAEDADDAHAAVQGLVRAAQARGHVGHGAGEAAGRVAKDAAPGHAQHRLALTVGHHVGGVALGAQLRQPGLFDLHQPPQGGAGGLLSRYDHRVPRRKKEAKVSS